jgi:hypothetical protein
LGVVELEEEETALVVQELEEMELEEELEAMEQAMEEVEMVVEMVEVMVLEELVEMVLEDHQLLLSQPTKAPMLQMETAMVEVEVRRKQQLLQRLSTAQLLCQHHQELSLSMA